MNKADTSAALWFATGVACGAAVGLLLAPYSGSRSRRILGEKGLEGLEDVVGKERIEKAHQVYDRGRESASVARDTIDVAKRAKKLTRPLGADD